MAITVGAVALIVAGVSAIGIGAAATNTKPVQSSKPDKRRTRDDYSGTSFTMNFVPTYGVRAPQPIKPIAPLSPIAPVSNINTVNAVQPISPINPTGYHKITNRTIYEDPIYNYYNDPYQVNSLADVWFNREGRNLVLEDLDMEWTKYVPGLSTLVVGVNYLKENYVDPIAQGNFTEAGINLLMASGEDLDIVANPIKGLILDGPKGFVRGLGIGSEGRTQYDYNVDTGNDVLDFVLNMGAEIASDPVNWFTFGGKAALKEGLTEAGEIAIKRTAKEAGEEIAEETAQKFAKMYARETVENTLTNSAPRTLRNSFNYLIKSGVSDDTARLIANSMKDTVAYYNQKQIVKGLYGLVKGADAVDNALLMVSPLGWALKGTGAAINKIAKLSNKRVLSKIKPYSKKMRSFKGATVLDPSKLNVEDVIDTIKHEQTINRLLGTRPDIKGLPTDDILVTKFAEYEMWKGNKTVTQFINMLKNEGEISPTLARTLRKNEEFLKYYEDSIVAQGTALESLYQSIAQNKELIKSRMRAALANQPNKAAQLAAADQAWSELLENIDVPVRSLSGYNEYINRRVIDAAAKLKAAKDAATKRTLKANLEYWNSLKNSFDEMLVDLELDIKDLPDYDLMQKALASGNPKQYIEAQAKSYGKLLEDARVEHRVAQNAIQTVIVPIRKQIDSYESVFQKYRITLKGDTVRARTKRAQYILDHPKYGAVPEDLEQALMDYIEIAPVFDDIEKCINNLDVNGLNRIIYRLSNDPHHPFFTVVAQIFGKDQPILESLEKYMRQLSESSTDINLHKEMSDKLAKARAYLKEPGVLKSVKSKNATLKNIQKYNTRVRSTNLFDRATRASTIKMKELNDAEWDAVLSELESLPALADIEDALADTARSTAADGGIYDFGFMRFTRDELQAIQELYHLKPENPKDLEQIVDTLYELGAIDFNSTSKKIELLEELDPSERYYSLKQEQGYTLVQLLNAYETSPVFKETIQDLANETNNTPVGTLFNIIETIDTSSLIFNTATIRHIKKDAKAQINFTNLFNIIMSSRNDKAGIREAFIDFLGKNQYKSIDEFLEQFGDGVEVSAEKIRDELDNRVNAFAKSGILKNGNLHGYYGLGDVDESMLHNAAYDVNVTKENFLEQVRRGYEGASLKDGEIFTVFDLETTGTSTDGRYQILQIYGHKYQKVGDDIVDLGSFERVIKKNKDQTITPEVAELLGVDLLRKIDHSKINEDDAIQDFLSFIEDSTLVGHNSNEFDTPFLEQRLGLKLENRKLDTLEIARKAIGSEQNLNNNIDLNAVKKYTKALNQYIQNQREVSNQFIKLVDKTTLDNMFDLARELTSSTGARFLNSKNIEQRIKGNVLEEALTQLLGRQTVKKFSGDLNPEIGQELVNATIDALPVKDDESLIVTIRNILSEIKQTNREGGTRIISSKELRENAGFATNIVAYQNSNLTENGYVPNQYIAKRIHGPSKYQVRVNEMQEQLNRNQELGAAFKRMLDDNTDPVTKSEASEHIALTGDNIDQAARVYYSNELIKHGATAETNLNDVGRAVVARGQDQVGLITQEMYEYSQKLAKVPNKETKFYSNVKAGLETKTILEAQPKELAAFMYDQAPRIRVGNINNKMYTNEVAKIVTNKEVYEEVGIHVVVVQDNLYLDLMASKQKQLKQISDEVNKDYKFKTYRIKKPENKDTQALFKAQDKLYEKANKIRKDPLPFNSHNTAVNNMYKDNWDALIRRTPKIEDSLVDNTDYITDFFKTRDPRQTYINLGDYDSRRLFDRFQQDGFRNTMTQLEKNIDRVDGRNKFIELNFTKDLSLNGPMYRNLSDEEILDLFNTKSKDYTVMVLTQDKDGNAIVKTITPRSVSDITRLKELGGVLAPRFYANKVVGTINKDVMSNAFKNPIAQFYYKYIVSTYKTIYLSTLGMLERNLNDILIKNAIGLHPDEVPDSLLQFAKAMQDFIEYDRTMKEIYDYTPKHVLNSEAVDYYFNSGTARMDRALFNEIHEYATSNVSAGLATAQEEALRSFYTKETASAFDKFFFENAFRKNTAEQINKMNTYIEHAGRLSNLRMSRLIGLDEIDAYNRALRTHFDYGVKSKTQLMAELVIPFVTFPLYNLQYWIDAAFESPWLVELLLDASRTSLDMENQKQFTIDNSYKLQAALLNGNVRIGNTLFKLNPSLFDALNLITQPGTQIEQRLSAPIKVGVDALLKTTGQQPVFNKESEFVNKTDTNLSKIGLGEVEKNLDKWGLYSITRAANNVLKGVATLDNIMGTNVVPDDFETIDSAADVVPSMFSDFKQNYGARLGENFTRSKIKTTGGTHYITKQSKTGVVVNSTFYPTKYPKVSYTAGRSYNRIPSARRYYSPRRYYPYTGRYYNWYKNWKANRVHPYYITQPATVESLQYVFKGLLYDLGMDKDMLRAYNTNHLAKHRDR